MLAGQVPLAEHDPEMFELIELEKARQWSGLELIASENFTSKAVMECLGSCLTNKYAEGLPFKRYYGGNEYIDQVETLCQTRALSAYGLTPETWTVNVQPYSGSPANFAVYTGLLSPGDRIMGLDLPSGGHLTHGFYTVDKKTGKRKPVSATSTYFESLPYKVSSETGLIDYDKLEELAALFKPNLIVAGGSAYPREWDYARFRKICDANGALLMVDMAHISGLVATGEADSPFLLADVVTTTTHKSLAGPRAGMIFCKVDERNMGRAIDNAVFPALQGGPHEHQIAGVATQLLQVMKPEFTVYAKQVRSNCRTLAAALIEHGFSLATDGSDNHLILWNLRPQGITGSKMQTVCDKVGITLNKNAIFGDRSAMTPGGVRIGTPAMTTRGLKDADFTIIAGLLKRCCDIAIQCQETCGSKKLKDFKVALAAHGDVIALREEVAALATSFPMPGFDVADMKYNDPSTVAGIVHAH